VAGSQCGPAGHCTVALCTCTGDADCAAGQRCGFGICVAL
jgi:hypothetical protein